MSAIITGTVLVGGVLVVSDALNAGAGLTDARAGSVKFPPRPASRTLPAGAPVPPGGWIWPVPLGPGGRKPQISSGIGEPRDGGARSHHGADVGYWRKRGELPQYIPGTREASKGGAFIMPDGTPIRAMADGMIWNVSNSPKGIQIVIDHGRPFATYYQHLRTTAHPIGSRGQRVKAGEVIGTVGNGHNPGNEPPDAYNHPHVEFWYDGGAEAYIDPASVLKLARY